MRPIRFGVHLSLGPRPAASLEEASSHGAECAQIFTSSPTAWKPPVRDAERYSAIRLASDALDVAPLVVHAIYLINLASPDPTLRARSRASLVATLRAAAELGVTVVTTHIGSHGGRGFHEVAPLVAEGVLDVLNQTPGLPDLALENSAGAGHIIGSTLEELGVLLDLAGRSPRLKVTLDTAHLCGAGWDFQVPDTAPNLVRAIETHVGMDRLALIHANDSKAPPGTRRDRHEVVGEGHVGQQGFKSLLAQPELRAVPWVLETPDLGDPDPAQRYRSLTTVHALDAEVLASRDVAPARDQMTCQALRHA